jgi:squalene cyclase
MHNLIDRYVECTSSSIQALALSRKLYPGHRRKEVDNIINKGASFIESMQRNDGSWLVFGYTWEYTTYLAYLWLYMNYSQSVSPTGTVLGAFVSPTPHGLQWRD